jgi:ABC-type maltose transport system permease subunit
LEPEVRAYLVRILNTMSLALIWMIINSTVGIMLEYAFIQGPISIGNILFYLWLIASTIALVLYLIKLWRKPLNIPQ